MNSHPKNLAREKAIYDLWLQQYSVTKISKRLKLPRSTVGYYIKKFNKKEKAKINANPGESRALISPEVPISISGGKKWEEVKIPREKLAAVLKDEKWRSVKIAGEKKFYSKDPDPLLSKRFKPYMSFFIESSMRSVRDKAQELFNDGKYSDAKEMVETIILLLELQEKYTAFVEKNIGSKPLVFLEVDNFLDSLKPDLKRIELSLKLLKNVSKECME